MLLQRVRRTSAIGFPLALLLLVVTGTASLTGACSDPNDPGKPSNDGGASACSNGGGPVPGDVDAHCTDSDGNPIVQETLPAACMDSSAGGAPEGAAGAAGEPQPEVELTLFNAEGDDDDCKYHTSFSASCIERNRDITLTLHASNRSDDSAVVGATPTTEIYLSDTHLAPNTKPMTVVVEPGVYKIGPVRFDKPGRWTVRFHLFEECLDAREDSPHGHVAFYVDVP